MSKLKSKNDLDKLQKRLNKSLNDNDINNKNNINILKLKYENTQLQEKIENQVYEIEQLKLWKEKALNHMILYAPKREKILQEKKEIILLKKELNKLQVNISERGELENELENLQDKDSELMNKISYLLNEIDVLKKELENEKLENNKKKSFIETNEKILKKLLEKLLQNDQINNNNNNNIIIKREYDVMKEIAILVTNLEIKNKISSNEYLEIKDELIKEKQINNKLINENKELNNKINCLIRSYDIEKAVVIGLERIQREKDNLIKQYKNENNILIKDREKLFHLLEDILNQVKKYIFTTQQEIKKKFGYIPDIISNPEILDKLKEVTKTKDFNTYLYQR